MCLRVSQTLSVANDYTELIILCAQNYEVVCVSDRDMTQLKTDSFREVCAN